MENDKFFEAMERVLDNPPKTKEPKEEKYDGSIYFLDKDYVKAQKSVDDCLRILPDYFPARDMKKKLESYNA